MVLSHSNLKRKQVVSNLVEKTERSGIKAIRTSSRIPESEILRTATVKFVYNLKVKTKGILLFKTLNQMRNDPIT